MSNKHTWQGSYDQLCGIYCAADIIARHGTAKKSKPYEDMAQQAFSDLMQAVEDCGYLKARKIAHPSGGFKDTQIVKIFNSLTSRKRNDLVATSFTAPWFKGLKNSERRELVLRSLGCAIIQEHGKDHWIGVVGMHPESGYICFDPQLSDNTSFRKKIRWGNGVLVTKSTSIPSKL